MQKCSICQKMLPADAFRGDKWRCAPCNSTRRKARYHAKDKVDPGYKAAQSQRGKENYAKNRDKIIARQKEYHKDPAVRKMRAEHTKRWHQRNPWYYNDAAARRTARMKIPAWADRFEIRCIYKLASAYRSIGLDVHVDHIVPLGGKTVCGLHTPDNLQILHASENQEKSCWRWPDMP